MDRRLVILDRDGVINRESSAFVKSPAEWLPLPGSIEAIAALSRAGFTVAVASNQSGLARGLFDRSALRAMHRKLRRLVESAGGRVDRIEVCPHGPDDDCSCRKPKPGLIYRLARHFEVDPADTTVIGDSLRDLQSAASAGARPILVRTGNGRETERALGDALAATPVFDNLAAAAAALTKA
ncbi:MAG: D-glycero-beta-D-manno-heptose 1,7-bisphosphate 7-phosphatase [Woeseiaceae bacterium]|jgi:D-glycero-D-manno-heptose 1,7-bisphosphate phosphatase